MKIGLIAGGSGGHLFPAIAVAEEALSQGYKASLLTDPRGERFLSSSRDLFDKITVLGPYPHRAAYLKGAAIGSLSWLKHENITSLVGFGGQFTALPLMVGRLLGRRCSLHQSDLVMGRANRWLAPFMHKVFVSFPQTLKRGAAKYEAIGTPVRRIFYSLPSLEVQPFTPSSPLKIAVFGGSQGAHFWTSLVPQALALLPEEKQHLISLVHQAPEKDHQELEQAYSALQARAEVHRFIEDVAGVLAKSHLVLARAGASTLAELMASGRPGFLVPYPYATQDHQLANALHIAQRGGGWVCPQEEASAERIAAFLEDCLHNPPQLLYAGERIRQMASRDAAFRLVQFCLAS